MITAGLGLLDWWWDIKFDSNMAPVLQEYKVIAASVDEYESRQEILRQEVKAIAENKVNEVELRDLKSDFQNLFDQIDYRIDILEMSDILHNHYSHPKVEKSK